MRIIVFSILFVTLGPHLKRCGPNFFNSSLDNIAVNCCPLKIRRHGWGVHITLWSSSPSVWRSYQALLSDWRFICGVLIVPHSACDANPSRWISRIILSSMVSVPSCLVNTFTLKMVLPILWVRVVLWFCVIVPRFLRLQGFPALLSAPVFSCCTKSAVPGRFEDGAFAGVRYNIAVSFPLFCLEGVSAFWYQYTDKMVQTEKIWRYCNLGASQRGKLQKCKRHIST